MKNIRRHFIPFNTHYKAITLIKCIIAILELKF